jgi:hypothetical protein
MAEAHLELGQLVEAADLYQRVISELGEGQLAVAAQEKLNALDRQLGRVSISSTPSGARIEIGGRDMGTAPLAEVRLPAGSIEIRATSGGRSEVQTLDVEAGGSHAVRFDLVEVAPPPPVMIATEIEEEEEEPVTGKWWFWTAIVGGVVIAGSVTAAVIATQPDGFELTGELGRHSLEEFQKR